MPPNHKQGESSQLSKDIGPRQFFSLAFGSIIGVGWVVALGSWLNQAGPLGAIIGIIGGGLLMMLIGFCYIEMSTMFPMSGGEVVYTYEIYGTNVSFAVGWLFTLAYIAVTAFEAISIGWIAGVLFPGIQGGTLYGNGIGEVRTGTLVLGLGGMILLTFLSYRGTRLAAGLQDWLTYSKIGLAIIFFTVGIGLGTVHNLHPLFQQSEHSALGGIPGIFLTSPFWYGGFNIIPQVMGEKAARTSMKTVGLTLILAIALSALFYCLVIAACSMSLPRGELITLELPAAAVFTVSYKLPVVTKMVLIAALLGNITAWNGVMVSGSRILFGLGRARIIWERFGRVHPTFHTPATSILFVGVIAAVGVFLGRSAIIPIVNLASACFALGYLLICLGVLILRRRRPEYRRPYRVPGGLITPTVATFGAVVVLFLALVQPFMGSKSRFPLELICFIVWILLGALFWVVAKKFRRGISEQQRRDLITETYGSQN